MNIRVLIVVATVAVAGCVESRVMPIRSPARAPATSSRTGPAVAALDPAGVAALRLRMEQDAKLLGMFSQELRGLAEEFTTAQRTLAGRTRATASESDNDTLESLLFRYVACRESLVDMAGNYKVACLAAVPGAAEQTRGSLLGVLARLLVRFYDAVLADLFLADAFAGEKLNAAYPAADLPAGFLRTIAEAAVSVDNREAQDAAWRLLTSELANPHSPYARIVEQDPECGVLVRAVKALHPRLEEQGARLATRQAGRDPRLTARANPARVAALTDRARVGTTSDLQAAVELDSRGMTRTIAFWVSDPLELTADQIAQVRSLVRPGDMVLTFRKGYLTNLFFPGKFKHGLTYIGEQSGRAAHAPSGSRQDLVEAVGDGVIFNSLDFILGGQISRLAIVRPRLTDADREAALVKLSGYMGRSYDLAFNFGNASRLCCTEVHHHVFNGRGPVRFKLVKRMGLMTLSADDILGQTVTSDSSGTDLILVVDAKPGRKKNEAVVLAGAAAAERIRTLLDL